MDHHLTVGAPTEEVFAHLTDPARLGHWLPQLVGVGSGGVPTLELGSAFVATLRDPLGDREVDVDVIAYEPPWLLACRLMLPAEPVVVRVTCTAGATGTRVHVHQTTVPQRLVVDLTGLEALVGSTGAPDLLTPHRSPSQEADR